jgi:DNA polymerase-3 subunit alpha
MAQERDGFVQGCAKNGVDQKTANEIFDLMEKFAEYGFNRSHSAAYGLISYQTAWLKTHHPVEFMAALLTSEKDNTDKVVAHIAEARADGITVLPPDVNDSDLAFGVSPDPKKAGKKLIRFGLGAIKGVGENSIEGILAARKTPFAGLFDFCGRIDTRKINRKTLEALVAAGAFDFTQKPRKALWDAIEPALAQGSAAQKDRESGQFGLFGGGKGRGEPEAPEERVFGKEEWSERERLAKEKEALGFYITGHPLARYADDAKRYATHTCASLASAKGFEKVAVAGVVAGYRERLTKTGKRIGFAALEDLTGTRDLVLYEDVLQKFESLVKGDEPLLVRGLVRLAEKFGADASAEPAEPSPEIKVDEVSRLADVRAAKATRVEFKLAVDAATPERLIELKTLLGKHPGPCAASLVVIQPGTAETRIVLKGTKVSADDDLFAAIDRLFGTKVCQVR